MVKFGEIAREVRTVWKEMREGVPVVGLEHIVPGEMELKKYDLPEENTFTKKFCKGQVLFGRRRAYQKKATVATFDGICSGDITVIEPIPGMVVPELLPFIVANDRFFDHAIQGSAGSLSPRVKWEHMANYEFELPTLGEQKVLANKLWAAYRLKEAYQRLLNATDEMVKSQFLEMFGNPQTCNIGVVGKEVFGFASGKAQIRENLNPAYNYNCYGGNGVTGKSKEFLVKESTIVIGRVGEYCGCIHLTTPYSWITDNAIYLKKCDSRYLLEFLEYLFKAMDFHRFASESGQPKITQAPLIESVYPLPTIEEQTNFLIIKRQADKSKFDGFKSQFLEMFGCEKYGWKFPTYTLSSKYNIGTGGTPDRKKGDFFGGGIPWVKSTEVNFNEVWKTEETLNEEGLSKSNCKLYDSGSILLAMYGQGATRGRVAKLCIPSTVNQAIAVIQIQSKEESNFVFNALKVNYDEIRAMAIGGNQQNLNLSLVGKIRLPIVSNEMISKFNTISNQADKSKFELRKAISAIDEVIKSLING